MRKVTRQAMYALQQEQSFNSKNTRVSGDTLYLFGNPIIRVIRSTRGEIEQYRLSMCGYSTNTTRDRLNGFCNFNDFRTVGFYQKKGNQYVSKVEIGSKDTIILDYRGRIVEIERHV